MRQRRSSTASSIATREESTPFTTRRGWGALVLDDQRLHLDRQRAAALERDGDAGAADRLAAAREEQAGRVGHLGDAVAGHLEAADLVGGAEPVLEGADEAQRGLAVALEAAHDIHDVFEQSRARRSSRLS